MGRLYSSECRGELPFNRLFWPQHLHPALLDPGPAWVTIRRRIVIVVSLAVVAPLILLFLSTTTWLIAVLLLIPIGGTLALSNSVVVVMAHETFANTAC